jgi:S-adenosylmethionine/arginine decarboxylase-like enzyme
MLLGPRCTGTSRKAVEYFVCRVTEELEYTVAKICALIINEHLQYYILSSGEGSTGSPVTGIVSVNEAHITVGLSRAGNQPTYI